MSHASGYVVFNDGLKLYYEYNGTADIVLPKLWETMSEMEKHWREDNPFDRECVCGNDEQVIVYTSYGGGWHFLSRACRKCKVITNAPNPFENMIDGEPNENPKTKTL